MRVAMPGCKSLLVFVRNIVANKFLCYLMLLLIAACSEKPPPVLSAKSNANTTLSNRLLAGNPIPVNSAFDETKYLNADFVRGAQLYDSWFNLRAVSPPATSNAIWKLLGNSTIESADTWRCSTCHGWDYLGVNGVFGNSNNPLYSGINGIVPAINQILPQQIWTFVRDGSVTDSKGKNAEHAFINQLGEEDIYALTRFIVTVRQENEASLSPLSVVNSKAKLEGDQSVGSKLFNVAINDSCASCHGVDGNAIAGLSVSQLAAADPAKALHRIRFGIANNSNPMPGVITTFGGDGALSLQQAGDITTFAAHGLDASHIRGGRLYDDWIIESGIDVTTLTPNPLWDLAPYPEFIPPDVNADPTESWRCVNCHAYDYEGGNGFEYNNLLDLKEDTGWTPENAPDSFTYLYEFLMNGFFALVNGEIVQLHNYGRFITADPVATPGLVEADLWDLADFLVEETVITDQYILPDIGTARGGLGHPADLAIGTEYYTGINQHFGPDDINCGQCHGADGLGIATVDLATLAWDDPWKFFHRTRFGTPRAPDAVLTPPFDATATVMPGILEITKQDGLTPSDNDDAMDVLLYVQLVLNGFTPP